MAAGAVPSSPSLGAQHTYTSPSQLRGVTPRHALRLDTTLAPYHREDARGLVTVAFLSAQARLASYAGLQVKWGFVNHLVSAGGTTRDGVVNPTVAALFATPLGADLRLAGSVAVGLPLGSGGGDQRDPEMARMQSLAALARSSMDNTSFAVNDVGVPLGVSLAYVAHGLTCQLDANLIPSVRAKGSAIQPDAHKVNSTYGLFLGHLVLPQLALGLELRYQRYLSTPAAVAADPVTRQNLTAALGARVIIHVGGEVSLRPGISYARSVGGAGAQQAMQMVQLDLPLFF